MNRYALPVTAVLMFLVAGSALAVPRAAESSGQYYLFSARELGAWHTGFSYRRLERSIRHDDLGVDRKLELSRASMYLGYDILPWVAVFGLVGMSDPDLSGAPGESDTSAEYGAGIWVNLLDHDLIDSLTLEHRIRVQALAQVTHSSPDYGPVDLSYTEFHGMLTLALLNELDSSKRYWPETVSLFVGPVVNYIDGSDFEIRNNEFGIVVGSDVQVSRRLSLSFMYEAYGSSDNSIGGSLNIRL